MITCYVVLSFGSYLFFLARKIFASRRMPKFIHKFSIIVGPLVFLVYLEDLPLRYLIYPGQLYNKYDLWRYPVLHSMLWCIISIVFSGFFAFVLRKSSFVRRYL